jgi:TonB family protein
MSSGLSIKLFLFAAILVALIAPVRAELSFQSSARPAPAAARTLSELKNPDARRRRDAAIELGELRARNATRALMETLSDKDASVREAAAFALGQITDRAAAERLARALSDKDAEVRASAAFALGMIGDRRSIPALSKALDDDDSTARASAIIALGLMQDAEAVDEIMAMLDDATFDVRYDSVWALGQIGEPDADGPVREAIANLDVDGLTDSLRESFRQAAQEALENLRTAENAQSEQAPRPRRATGVISDSNRYSNITRPASVRQMAQAVATERALRARITGSVGLRALVAADGRAARVYVTRRLGYGLDQRAVESVLQYKFDPAMQRGLPQATWIELEVKF